MRIPPPRRKPTLATMVGNSKKAKTRATSLSDRGATELLHTYVPRSALKPKGLFRPNTNTRGSTTDWAVIKKNCGLIRDIFERAKGRCLKQKTFDTQLRSWLHGQGCDWSIGDVEASSYSLRAMLRALLGIASSPTAQLPRAYTDLEPLVRMVYVSDEEGDANGEDSPVIVAPRPSPPVPIVPVSSTDEETETGKPVPVDFHEFDIDDFFNDTTPNAPKTPPPTRLNKKTSFTGVAATPASTLSKPYKHNPSSALSISAAELAKLGVAERAAPTPRDYAAKKAATKRAKKAAKGKAAKGKASKAPPPGLVGDGPEPVTVDASKPIIDNYLEFAPKDYATFRKRAHSRVYDNERSRRVKMGFNADEARHHARTLANREIDKWETKVARLMS